MHSLYDQPRAVPRPVFLNNRFESPMVPDVSLLFQNQPPQDNVNIRKSSNNEYGASYNTWKIQNQVLNKENTHVNEKNSFSLQCGGRKQVRFENPINQNQLHQKPKPHRNVQANFVNHGRNFQISHEHVTSSTLISKPFEQIYMENIPNRHLDLSIIDQPSCKEKSIPSNTKTLSNENKVESKAFEDIGVPRTYPKSHFSLDESLYDYTRNRNKFCNDKDMTNKYVAGIESAEYNKASCNKPKLDRSVEYCNKPMQNHYFKDTSEEPTTKDLLKIIQQQNEQIIMLQKQVTSLLDINDHLKKIEPPQPKLNYYPLPSGHDIPVFTKTPDKNLKKSKFAIDVMTSFEVSIRPQQNFILNKFVQDHEPKICEIMDGDCEKIGSQAKENTKCDYSLVINEPIQVQENCPSPEHSIHVDMQDYSSDSDSDDFVNSDLGWTIYNDIMGQVNNVLQRKNSENTLDKIKEKTMRKVQEATLRHLKSIGVNINNIPFTSDTASNASDNDTEQFASNEISFAVKQLLMKYLPNEELAKITCDKKRVSPTVNKGLIKENKRRPEFSFATLEYLKKYNLIENDAVPNKKQVPSKEQLQTGAAAKFLDITALKQQPKLL